MEKQTPSGSFLDWKTLQQPVNGCHLLGRHTLNLAVVRDTAKQYAAVCVGEGDHFIGQIIPPGAYRAIVTKLYLFELASTVLTQF